MAASVLQSQKLGQLTLEEFLDWYPDSGGHFELRKGEIFKLKPTGIHEQVAGFLALELGIEIRRLELPFLIPRQGIVKAIDSNQSGYIPDVLVLDSTAMINEPLWQKRSTITQGETVKLAVEVVSPNWQDDYLMKLGEYEKLGIAEYWIVDYLGLGGKRYIGSPKQPTVSICTLEAGEYSIRSFQGQEQLQSSIFPDLNLKVGSIVQQGQSDFNFKG